MSKTRLTDYPDGTVLEIIETTFHDYPLGTKVKVANADRHSYHVYNHEAPIDERRWRWVKENQVKPI